MQKIATSIIILSLVYATLNAQIEKEQLRSVSIEVLEAEIAGNDLYLSTDDGIYHTNLNEIDFKRITSKSISDLTLVGNRVFYNSTSIATLFPSYCNGGNPASSRKTLAMESAAAGAVDGQYNSKTICLLYTSPSPRDATLSRMPSSA